MKNPCRKHANVKAMQCHHDRLINLPQKLSTCCCLTNLSNHLSVACPITSNLQNLKTNLSSHPIYYLPAANKPTNQTKVNPTKWMAVLNRARKVKSQNFVSWLESKVLRRKRNQAKKQLNLRKKFRQKATSATKSRTENLRGENLAEAVISCADTGSPCLVSSHSFRIRTPRRSPHRWCG